MIGIPVVFPDQVGVPIQKVFIGDADGTLWRIDLSKPCDTIRTWGRVPGMRSPLPGPHREEHRPAPAPPVNASASRSTIPPVLSTDEPRGRSAVINVATGDQESIVVSTDVNYLYSIRRRDAPDASSPPLPRARTNWYTAFSASRARHRPDGRLRQDALLRQLLAAAPVGKRLHLARHRAPLGPRLRHCEEHGGPISGGVSKWCPAGNTDPATGALAPAGRHVARLRGSRHRHHPRRLAPRARRHA